MNRVAYNDQYNTPIRIKYTPQNVNKSTNFTHGYDKKHIV